MGLYGIVYKATNRANDRRYVGFTTTNLERRWILHRSDARRGSSYLFHKAIRKHGEEKFDIEEIASSWDDENLRALERLLIEQESTMSSVGGYNLTGGGEGQNYSPEVSQRIGQKNRNHPRCRRITHDGLTMTITQWEDHLGFKRLTIHDRLSAGWSDEKCVTTPIQKPDSPIGKRFGRLLVVGVSEKKTKSDNRYLECKCDCGNTHYATHGHLKGRTKSCGCLNRELTIARNKGRIKPPLLIAVNT